MESKTTETVSDNELIAKFMDSQKKPMDRNSVRDSIYVPGHTMGSDGKWFRDYSDIPFHKSWDWLMPVVEKIKNHEYTKIDINGHRRYERIGIYLLAVDITETHREIVEFIRWYNSKSPATIK